LYLYCWLYSHCKVSSGTRKPALVINTKLNSYSSPKNYKGQALTDAEFKAYLSIPCPATTKEVESTFTAVSNPSIVIVNGNSTTSTSSNTISDGGVPITEIVPTFVPPPTKTGASSSSACPVCNRKYYRQFCKVKKTTVSVASAADNTGNTASNTTATTAEVTPFNPNDNGPISTPVKGVLIGVGVAVGVSFLCVIALIIGIIGVVVYVKTRPRSVFSVYDATHTDKFQDVLGKDLLKGDVSDDDSDEEIDGAMEQEIEEAVELKTVAEDSTTHKPVDSSNEMTVTVDMVNKDDTIALVPPTTAAADEDDANVSTHVANTASIMDEDGFESDDD